MSSKRIATISVMTTIVLAAIAAVWGLAADRSALVAGVASNATVIQDHEERVRVIEKELPKIATDVGWIRQTMEQERKD